jgi:hypothetical protein
MSQRHLDNCGEPAPDPDPIRDPIPPNCGPKRPSLRDVPGRPEEGWDQPPCTDHMPSGVSGLCDPMQAGKIINDPSDPSPHTIYRYAKGVRGCDEAMLDLFRGMVVIDEDGKAHNIPIMWASQERAVQFILGENARKNDPNMVIDRPRLPLLSMHSTSYQFNQSRYIYHKALDYMRASPGTPCLALQEAFRWTLGTSYMCGPWLMKT